ncbi:RfbQ [Mariniradius saccharolyticus AK6]|uniref:RfbQ n=1 Tax=Mariniradius saccharolyticus AK6 TaxID=1239962 RepID=M7X4B5_9BACT|nr:glycosyltransferase family A protein [Mariniradius saccharolyticus]EMS32305.1 RfbQ [Mariniradius saccharolyticus AK6]
MSLIFSIIVPTFRDGQRLVLLLESLRKQSVSKGDWEVIVVNNDPSAELTLPKALLSSINLKIIDEAKPGSYAARNKGILAANGSIFAFTDSDCLPADDWLAVAFDHFSKEENQGTGILTGPVPLFYKDPKSLSDAEIYEKYTGFTTEAYAKEGHAITANWFSPASVIKEFGGFNAQLKSNGDSELSGQISRKYKVVYLPSLIVNHPARYRTEELVNKYKRLIGGTYARRFAGRKFAFLKHVLDFGFRRYRFWLKRFFRIPFAESIALLRVCNAINLGVLQEYFSLIGGGDTRR